MCIQLSKHLIIDLKFQNFYLNVLGHWVMFGCHYVWYDQIWMLATQHFGAPLQRHQSAGLVLSMFHPLKFFPCLVIFIVWSWDGGLGCIQELRLSVSCFPYLFCRVGIFRIIKRSCQPFGLGQALPVEFSCFCSSKVQYNHLLSVHFATVHPLLHQCWYTQGLKSFEAPENYLSPACEAMSLPSLMRLMPCSCEACLRRVPHISCNFGFFFGGFELQFVGLNIRFFYCPFLMMLSTRK